MKKISTLPVFFLLLISTVFGAAPTVPSSNLTFNGLDGGGFTGNYTNGNGANRIVVMKEGSPVTGVPVNGVDYNANSIFGSNGTLFTAPGEYVVAKTGWNTFSVTGLKAGTLYYVAIFEYNGSGASAQYLTVSLAGSQSTYVAPTTQTSAIISTGQTGNTLSFSWTKGNGTGRMIIAHKGAAVNVSPADLTNYFPDAIFGSGTKIGTDNFVVYKGNGTAMTVRNLEPNTTYHFSVFEFNGTNSPVYLSPAATASFTTDAGPSVAPSAPGFNYVEGTSFTINVNVGNGTKRLFIIKKGYPVTAAPVNGVTYTANAAYGTASTEIAPGEYVVAATGGNGINITNLEPNTTYHFRIYEYDVDNAGNTYYLTSSYAVKSGSTAITPTTVATNFSLPSLTGSGASVAFTPGNGTYRMVIMKAGSPVDAAPTNLVKYSASQTFGSGAQVTPGNYVIHFGMNGAQFPVNGLQPGITYHVSIYEFNGASTPVYSNTGGVYSFTVPLEPTSNASAPWTAFNEGSSFRLIWTNGNGARRIVIAKKGSAVTAKPVDANNYTANAAFGQGTQLAPGEFVVYDGPSTEVNLTNLEIGATYHFAVFEYNVAPDGKADYLTSTWLATTGATVTWPTTQAAITSVSNIAASQATVNFTKGNGANRLFVMKQGSATTVDPQDLTRYTYNTNFGTTATHMGDGNYAVAIMSSGGSFNVTNLQPNTTYHVTAYELNGSNEPAYLRTSPSRFSFTTPDAPGAVTPTTAASNPIISGVDGNKLTFKWTNGNGEKRIVVMKKGSAVNFVPASATAYTANASFGSGTDLGNGQYIVYNANGSTVDITNLEPSSTYYFAVYEYSGAGSLLRYLTSQLLTATASTSAAPTTPASSVATGTAAGQITINWANGNGAGRIVVMKEGSAVTAIPSNLSVYPANAAFKSGSQIAAGEYVVYAGSGNSVTVTALESKTYHFRIFEFNGSAAPVYNITDVVAGSATVASTLPVKLLYFTAHEQNGNAVIEWATSQEINNDHFIVERSADGTRFEPVKTIAGAGNSNSTTKYSYVDAGINGKMYYRLQQVDKDGHAVYSPVAAVNVKNENAGIGIYPNPVKDRFKISLPPNVAKGILLVYDGRGVLVSKQEVSNGQQVNAAGWATGMYYVTVQANGRQLQGRLLKQ